VRDAGSGASLLSGAKAPAPGSAEELRRFAQIQERLVPLFRRVYPEARFRPDPSVPRTVVVVPSLSLDAEELAKISGVHHYEERLLCMLMFLRMPHTHMVFVTSQPIAEPIVDYYLHLLPGVPLGHARRRLTLLSCHDASDVPLTQKILERPRLMERTLAVRLDIPLYGNDPKLAHLGSKSGGREVFREAGVPVPDGFEHLRDEEDIVEAVAELKRRNPGLKRAVIKLNEGFSGEGNAMFRYDGAPEEGNLTLWIKEELPRRI